MINFPQYYAQSTLWSAPRMDNQSILDMSRISPVTGVYNLIRIMMKTYPLPVKKKKFHVFQIGQLTPELIGFISDYQGRWIRADVGCELKNMVIETYFDNGIMYPRQHVWYQYTEDKNLIVAFEDVPSLGNFNIEHYEPFLRVYTGAWFHILRRDHIKDLIKVDGRKIVNDADKLALWKHYQEYTNKIGHLFTYINGVYYSGLVYTDLKQGDLVEFFYDSTVYKKVKVALKDLNTFDSLLDLKRKYLITYAGSDLNSSIDFYDDMDVYITVEETVGNYKRNRGVYYHRNMKDSVRQLTNRDYSITVPYVVGLTEAHEFMRNKDLSEVFVELYVKRSGFNRGTVYVHNRIHELYKLPYRYKVAAMLGVDSNITEWRADTLEQSAYSKIMSQEEPPRDMNDIRDAYGYNALSSVLGATPTHEDDFLTDGGLKRVTLAPNLQGPSVHFEYDREGKLLGYYNTNNSCSHVIRNKGCHLVESMVGFGSPYIDDIFSPKDGTAIDPTYDYRLYRCEKGDEYKGLEHWEDITELNYHTVIDGKLKWVVDMKRTHTTILRTNKKVLVYELEVGNDSGLMTFPLIQKANFNNKDVNMRIMVPMGQLDVFMNGYSLVEGIDYMVDYPMVYITSKKYLTGMSEGKKQHIVVRFSQFCNKDMTRIPVKETGYIYDGALSKNKHFNIQDDKVLRIIAGGGTFHRKEVGLEEKGSKTTYPYLVKREGYPYQVKDIIVPLRNQVPSETYKLREISEDLDNRISDYMTQYQEYSELRQHPQIKELYPLFSPMLSRIIYDIKRGIAVFPHDLMVHRYTDEDVLKFIEPYQHLRKVDPVFNDTSIDLQYVIIHPHILMDNIPLSIYEYRLLNRIVKVICHDKVKLSHFVRSIPVEHG